LYFDIEILDLYHFICRWFHFRFGTSRDVLDSNRIDLELDWLAIAIKDFMW